MCARDLNELILFQKGRKMGKIVQYKKNTVIQIFLAFIFTTFQVTGYQISMRYGTTVHRSTFFQQIGVLSVGQTLLLFVAELFIWYGILYFLFRKLEGIRPGKDFFSKRQYSVIWFASALLLFLCWIPCLLAGYPGFYNYDAFNQVPQALYEEVPYSAHHPLLHTLLMGKIIAFGYHMGDSSTLNDGIFLHSIFQMFLCAVSFGYVISSILRVSKRRWMALISLVYYGFFPLIPMYAISTTKDTIFAVLLQLFILFLYELFQDLNGTLKNSSKIIRLVVTALLMCLFRKNGIYIVVGLLPFVLYYAKEYRKKCTVIWGAVILSYLIINNGLISLLQAQKGSSEEALSVPIQQVARVYYDYGEEAFTSEELDMLYEGITAEALRNYNPFLSDNIKNSFDYEVLLHHKREFLMLWLEKGMAYPKAYLCSFLDNTYQAWYPGTSIYDTPYGGDTYYFDMDMCPGGEHDSKAPKLLAFYERIATGYYYQKIPVLRLFFSIGFMFWVALFCLFYGMSQKNKALMIATLASVLCCVTALLGPISLVRYYLILFYGFPVSLGFLLHKE